MEPPPLRAAHRGKLPHLPVHPDDMADHVLDQDRAKIAIIFYLLPPFAHGQFDTIKPDAPFRPFVERIFRDTLGDSPDRKLAQAMTSAEKARLLILHHGGPVHIPHGKQRELCTGYKIHVSTFCRELRKLRALMRAQKVPSDWSTWSWRR